MSNKIVALLVCVLLMFMGLMGAGFYFMWSKMATLEKAPAVQHGEEDILTGPIYKLDTFIVNLADPGGNRFLRVTMDLELRNQNVAETIEKSLSQIRNGILMVLPTKTIEDLSSIDGKKQLRDEIIDKLNDFLRRGSVTNIYFTEFVIQ